MEYGNDSIKSLSDKDAVRLRPANILGSDGIDGCFHCLVEIFDNALDESRGGHGSEINIKKYKDGSYSVQDFGRGVPMDWNKSEEKYNYELIFAQLYAGGKYSNDETDSYSFAKGLNGLGASASAFSSEYFYVKSNRDGLEFKITMTEGDFKNDLEKSKSKYESTGTFIKWKPDKNVFVEYDIPFEWIIELADKQALVNKGVTINIVDELTDKSLSYFYENGIVDYVNTINNDKNITDVIYLETETRGKDREDKPEYKSKYEVAFCFNNENTMMESYHNSSFLKYGGSPHDAIKLSFVYSVDKIIKSNGKYAKNEKKITFDDIKDSLVIVTNTYSTETSYQNQTKFSITNKFIKDFLNGYLREQLEIYFIENPLETEKIIEIILINKRSREKAESTRLNIKKKLQGNVGNGLRNKIEGLNECDMKNTELSEREFWTCEGVSASSTITDARDSRTMGTYALRGRFISSLKNSVTDVLKNQPAMGIIQSLGCGIEIPSEEMKKVKDTKTFDIENLRYGKIIIACDSDSFGKGIGLSIITFFYKFMPTLLKQNRIYISVSPRYEIKTKNDNLFAYSENEKDSIVKKLEKSNTKFEIGIVKGLGELNKDVYWDYVMNPETRILKQLIYKEEYEQEMNHCFDILMGDNIEERKKYVKENIINLDLTMVD